ncbi:MAG: sulfotransferase domain-containing protein [Chloroflexota bacterium]|nr:sulfotransferase domain-containing protein [Chloroflexota bacterium]
MRIVIVSSPKSGNHWIKCLMGQIYQLNWLGGDVKPLGSPAELTRLIARGGFPDDSIFHQHSRFSKGLADTLEATPARIVTIVRDPYDVFVSLFAWVQNRVANEGQTRRTRPRDILIGKPIDHPDVLNYLTHDFGDNIARANDWLHSGRAVVVRYEALHQDPVAELTRATEQITPISPERITDAIEACRVENMRQMNEKFTWHIRTAKVGDSKEKLSAEHLAIFRDRYSDAIRSLGYEVRQPG